MTDDEYLNQISTIEIYCEILLGILRYSPDESFHFEKPDCSLRVRACIDLIEDTEFAKQEFIENGVGKDNSAFGKIYLRLYGVLNAMYLQSQALIELLEIFKIDNRKEIRKELNGLGAIEVRNKVGAHTPRHKVHSFDRNSETDSYRLARSKISQFADELIIVSSHDKVEKFHLMSLIEEFSRTIEYYLDIISDKTLGLGLPNENEFKKWVEYRLNFTRSKSV